MFVRIASIPTHLSAKKDMIYRSLVFLCGAMLVLTVTVHAQHQVIPVWPEDTPGMERGTQDELITKSRFDGFNWVRNVTAPTLTVYLPDSTVANGTAIIIAPGGGFHFLSVETEGSQVAEWLAERGIAAFMLKYRTVPTAKEEEAFFGQVRRLFTDMDSVRPVMDSVNVLAIQDGQEAIRLLRSRADEWGIDREQIGIIGFSAGARLASGVVLAGDDPESRPNFVAPIYGGAPAGEVNVPEDAPPLFTLVAQDDRLAGEDVVDLYMAWNKAGREAELHVYSKGGHGFGMKKQDLPIDTWIERFEDWLQAQGILGTPN